MAAKGDIARAHPLAGRDGELHRLDGALSDALSAGEFRVAFLRGPEGVGRTALLDAVCERLPASVALVRATAPRQTGHAWTLAGEVAKQLLGLLRPTLTVPRVRALEDRLGPIFGGPSSRSASSLDIADALTDALLAVAGDRPVVLLLDDLDAADAASFGVMSALVAALSAPAACRAADQRATGGLILLSLRDDALTPALEELLARTPALSLPLAPLDAEGVRAWLARTGAVEKLLAASGGVPGRLDALLTASSPVDLTERRLRALAAPDLDVLSVLALAGHPVDEAFVAQASQRRDSAARLERLADAAFITRTPGPGRTLFSLTRSYDAAWLLAAKPSPQRAVSVAEALSARGDHQRAFELYADAGAHDRAVSSAKSAASALEASLALDAAQSVLARAASLTIRKDERLELLLWLSRIHERRDDLRGALAALGRARALVGEEERRSLRARIARLCLPLGAPRVAERLARSVLETRRDDAPGHEAVVALCGALYQQGAWADALALADEVSEASSSLRLEAENTRGKALLALGRLEEAGEVFASNVQLACDAPVERARASLNLGVVAHRLGRFDDARVAYAQALTCEHATAHAPLAHANLASLLLVEGEAEQALLQSHRALAAFARSGRRKEQAHAAQNLARIYLYLGEFDRAADVSSHAHDLARRVGDPYLEAGARLVSGEVILARAPAEAATPLLEAATAFRQLDNARYLRESLVLAAEALTRAAAFDEARRALDEAREAGAWSVADVASGWHLADAELALVSSPPALDACAQALSAAKRALLESPQLELPARLHLLSARLAELRGEPEAAQVAFVHAARVVESLAARLSPERRGVFCALPTRRAILEAAGSILRAPGGTPSAPREAPRASTVLVGKASSVLRVNALVARLGPTNASVLVRGESGTGKELVARALHDLSPRRDLPLVAVNCGALSDELLLSELFGHEKGAFTGAVRERKGRFELADGGTIFLDEVGDISPRAQVALLRVLQEKTFERVGGGRTMTVDVRVVCATNRNLEQMIASGEFREDLYYRLRGATLLLPPLRERLEDLPLLADHFFARRAEEQGRPPTRLSKAALPLLARYRWPGNVRELFNVLDSALLLSTEQELGPDAFELFPELFELPTPAPQAQVDSPDFYRLLKAKELSLRDLRNDVEVECIAAALQEAGGNISEAARLLKVKRSRLSQIVNDLPRLRALASGASLADEGEDDGTPLA